MLAWMLAWMLVQLVWWLVSVWVLAWAKQLAGELEEEWGWLSLEETLELVLQVVEWWAALIRQQQMQGRPLHHTLLLGKDLLPHRIASQLEQLADFHYPLRTAPIQYSAPQ
jgi:hypothetical protein